MIGSLCASETRRAKGLSETNERRSDFSMLLKAPDKLMSSDKMAATLLTLIPHKSID